MKEDDIMKNIILEPDFKGFDGVYAGGINIEPPTEKYNYTEMISYIKRNKKEFSELTPEEIKRFKTN